MALFLKLLAMTTTKMIRIKKKMKINLNKIRHETARFLDADVRC